MTNTPSTAPLGTTTGTTTSTTNLPYPQTFSLGDLGYKADVGANAHQLSGSASPTATSVTISLGSLSPEGNILYDAKSATVIIANGATGQTITDAHLQFTDTVGGQTVTIDYPCAGIGQWTTGAYGLPSGVTLGTPMSIAQNTNQTFTFSLTKGILKNVQLVVTYAAAPTAGTVNAQLGLSSQALPFYAVPPMLVASFSPTALTPSAVLKLSLNGVFARNASMRTVEFVNASDKGSGTIYMGSYDSTVVSAISGIFYIKSTLQAVSDNVNNGNIMSYSDSFGSANAANQTNNQKRFADVVDSLFLQLTWGTTAATTGAFDVYVSQQLG